MDQFLQHLANALVLGSTFALLGIGLTFIFGIMNIVNFAHGEFYVFGAYMVYFFSVLLGINFFASIFIAISLGVILGALFEFVLLSRLRATDIETTMLVTVGAWIIMKNTELLAWGGVARFIKTPFPLTPLKIGGISVPWIKIFVFGTAIALIVGSYQLIQRSRFGKAMRATFQDHDTAALMGVNISVIYLATFAIGSGFASAAGALLGPVFIVSPRMGDVAVLTAFAVVILGGLGNTKGAVIGGFVLALAQEFGAAYISSGYREAMGFILIILVLMIKPTGIFARSERVG